MLCTHHHIQLFTIHNDHENKIDYLKQLDSGEVDMHSDPQYSKMKESDHAHLISFIIFFFSYSFHTPSHSFYYMWHIIFLYIKEGSTNQKVIGPSGVKFDPFKQIIKFKPSECKKI